MARRAWTLSAKLGTVGGVLLTMVLASIALTLWVTWQLEGGAAAVNEAGRMRMQTWRLAQALPAGDDARLQAQLARFDATLALLRDGDAARPLFVPRDAASQRTFAAVQRGWLALRAAWAAPAVPDADAVAAQADAFVVQIDAFVSAIEHQLALWTTALNAFQFLMMALAIAAAVTLLYSAYLFVFNPLARLQAGLALVGKGELSARVAVDTNDEFGELSDGFNRMAQTLEGLYDNLETRVREKTLGLQAEQSRLAALYEAAAFVAAATSLDELAQGFARQLRRVAQADASAVRWSDEGNLRYLLLAADCLPQHVVDAERCVPTGSCLCGQPRDVARTQVFPLAVVDAAVADEAGEAGIGARPRMLGRCANAGYAAIVSVPVRLHERLVGEVDLFYRHVPTLGDDDRTLLETLASHLAGAIEGLRASALEREAAVAEERGLLARELHDSIAQSLAFLRIQVSLLRDAQRRADAPGVERTLAELDAGVSESLSDVRELLIHFRTRTNAEDIAQALSATLRKFEHQTGLATRLDVRGHGLPLPADVQVQVLHVVQEALSNVRKHANAAEVRVEVDETPRWRVRVIDDGRGFGDGAAKDGATTGGTAADATADAAKRGDRRSGRRHASVAAADETHVGLRIMRERAARIGATVELTSAPGAGTCVELTLHEAERAAA